MYIKCKKKRNLKIVSPHLRTTEESFKKKKNPETQLLFLDQS